MINLYEVRQRACSQSIAIVAETERKAEEYALAQPAGWQGLEYCKAVEPLIVFARGWSVYNASSVHPSEMPSDLARFWRD